MLPHALVPATSVRENPSYISLFLLNMQLNKLSSVNKTTLDYFLEFLFIAEHLYVLFFIYLFKTCFVI